MGNMEKIVADNKFLQFLASQMPVTLLDEIVVWISENMELDEVFTEAQIKGWLSGLRTPTKMLENADLEEWAHENGYMTAEEWKMPPDYD